MKSEVLIGLEESISRGLKEESSLVPWAISQTHERLLLELNKLGNFSGAEHGCFGSSGNAWSPWGGGKESGFQWQHLGLPVLNQTRAVLHSKSHLSVTEGEITNGPGRQLVGSSGFTEELFGSSFWECLQWLLKWFLESNAYKWADVWVSDDTYVSS